MLVIDRLAFLPGGAAMGMWNWAARRAVQGRALVQAYRLCRRFAARFGRKPVLVAVGARDGISGIPLYLARWGVLDVIGFEPDQIECEWLRKSQPFATVIPFALGDRAGTSMFYVTSDPACASCLEPDRQVLSRYPARSAFDVQRVCAVELHRFDELYPQRISHLPDFVQIDVQGFEQRVLEGFGDHLRRVVGLQAEAHFRPLYKGQPLLWELRDFLAERGLTLRHVEPKGPFEGEVVEAEVWFSRLDGGEESGTLLRIWETMSFLKPPTHYFPRRIRTREVSTTPIAPRKPAPAQAAAHAMAASNS